MPNTPALLLYTVQHGQQGGQGHRGELLAGEHLVPDILLYCNCSCYVIILIFPSLPQPSDLVDGGVWGLVCREGDQESYAEPRCKLYSDTAPPPVWLPRACSSSSDAGAAQPAAEGQHMI